MGRHVAKMEEGKDTFKIVTGKHTRKRSLRRPRHSWKDNIKMDFKQISVNMRNWIGLAQDRDYWEVFV